MDYVIVAIDLQQTVTYAEVAQLEERNLAKVEVAGSYPVFRSMNIGLVAIAKTENNYLREWVEHYHSLGFTRIILCDNNDIDGERFEDVIGDYIVSGFVKVEDYRGKRVCQILAYNDSYRKYCHDFDWILFADCDEFLELEKAKTVEGFLNDKRYEGFNVIRICWKNYTDSGMLDVINGNYSYKRFTEPLRYSHMNNRNSKSFIRTSIGDVKFTVSMHWAVSPIMKTCNTIGQQVGNFGAMLPAPVWRIAWLSHCRYKTIGEYVKVKMKRGYADRMENSLDLGTFFSYNQKTPDKIAYAKSLGVDI